MAGRGFDNGGDLFGLAEKRQFVRQKKAACTWANEVQAAFSRSKYRRKSLPNLRILQKSQAALLWRIAWRCAAIPTPNGRPLPKQPHIQKQPAPRKIRCRLLFRLIYSASASENAAPMSNARPAKNACALIRLLPAGCNWVMQSAFSPHATTMPSASAAKMRLGSP